MDSHFDVHTVKSLRQGGVDNRQKLPKELGNETVFPFLSVKLMFVSALSFFAWGCLQQLKTVPALVEEHHVFSCAVHHNLTK